MPLNINDLHLGTIGKRILDVVKFCYFNFAPLRFGALLQFQSPREMDVLLDEFVEYQLLQDDDIPSDVWGKASIVIDDDTTYIPPYEYRMASHFYLKRSR